MVREAQPVDGGGEEQTHEEEGSDDIVLHGPDACLAFLIQHQDKWTNEGPEIVIGKKYSGEHRVIPVRLIGVIK
jgi:hypothetical protein